MNHKGAIGVFDSGYGGLTVLKEIIQALPNYTYVYLGDNARAPYGNRSFETVYQYTLEAVDWFFKQGCPLIIIACNTASAKALRTIQQNDLKKYGSDKKVLGVIRPTTEIIGTLTQNKKIGILGTTGTIRSNSYPIEISKFFPEVEVSQQDCPLWVPLIENEALEDEGTGYFVAKNMQQLLSKNKQIDTVLLACTHYPLLLPTIKKYLPRSVKILTQGAIVAKSLKQYLLRHPEVAQQCVPKKALYFYTTDDATVFSEKATFFFGQTVAAKSIHF